MNCDDAFDALTDPALRHSDELTRHLSHCPRCRQMKDVLSPAIDLLVSTSAGDSAPFGTLPRAYAEAGLDLERATPRPAAISADAILLAERTAAELSRQSGGSQPLRRRFGSLMRIAAILLLGAAITLSATAWTNRGSSERSNRSGAATASDCLWVQHNAQSKPTKARGSRQVVLSCVECHLGRSFE